MDPGYPVLAASLRHVSKLSIRFQAFMPTPWQVIVWKSRPSAGVVTLKMAPVSFSATTMAVRVCKLGAPHVIADLPSAKAMKTIT